VVASVIFLLAIFHTFAAVRITKFAHSVQHAARRQGPAGARRPRDVDSCYRFGQLSGDLASFLR